MVFSTKDWCKVRSVVGSSGVVIWDRGLMVMLSLWRGASDPAIIEAVTDGCAMSRHSHATSPEVELNLIMFW